MLFWLLLLVSLFNSEVVLIIYAAIIFHAMSWMYPKRKTSRGLFEPLTILFITNQIAWKLLEETDLNSFKT